MKSVVTAFLSILAAAVCVGQSPGAEKETVTVLDIASREVQVLPRVRIPRPRPVVTDTASQRGNVEVTLKPLLHDTFTWSEEFIYEVSVRNVGTRPVDLPWSPNTEDWGSSPDSAEDARGATVTIAVFDATGTEQLGSLDPQILVGTLGQSRSLHRLAPSRTAVLRLKTAVRSSLSGEAERIVSQPEGRVTFRAVLLGDELPVATSHNALSVRIERRLQ